MALPESDGPIEVPPTKRCWLPRGKLFTLGIAKNAHPLVATPGAQGLAASEDHVATPSTPAPLRHNDRRLSPPHSDHPSEWPHTPPSCPYLATSHGFSDSLQSHSPGTFLTKGTSSRSCLYHARARRKMMPGDATVGAATILAGTLHSRRRVNKLKIGWRTTENLALSSLDKGVVSLYEFTCLYAGVGLMKLSDRGRRGRPTPVAAKPLTCLPLLDVCARARAYRQLLSQPQRRLSVSYAAGESSFCNGEVLAQACVGGGKAKNSGGAVYCASTVCQFGTVAVVSSSEFVE